MTRLLAIIAAAAVTSLASPSLAAEPTEEEVEKILAVLADMQCEMDEDDIDKEDDGYELDDVFCADGQYDIDMNATFEVVEKRKE